MKVTIMAGVVILCSRRLKPSQAFLAPPSSWSPRSAHSCKNTPHQHHRHFFTECTTRRCLKRSRPGRQRLVAPPVLASTGETSEGETEWEGNLLELDVVEYRRGGDDGKVELASYIGHGMLQPLLTREESGPNLFFHDEEAQPISVSGGSCRIVRVIDEVYFSQRIVEDRVKNPHGEEAEDCFLLEGTLNPSTVIRVEHRPE